MHHQHRSTPETLAWRVNWKLILFLHPFYFGPQMWTHTYTLLHRDSTEKRKRHSCVPVLHIITTGQWQHTANFQMYHLPLSCEVQHDGFKVDSLSIVFLGRRSSNATQKHKIIFKEGDKEQKQNTRTKKNHNADVATGKISQLTIKLFMEMSQNCKCHTGYRSKPKAPRQAKR